MICIKLQPLPLNSFGIGYKVLRTGEVATDEINSLDKSAIMMFADRQALLSSCCLGRCDGLSTILSRVSVVVACWEV